MSSIISILSVLIPKNGVGDIHVYLYTTPAPVHSDRCLLWHPGGKILLSVSLFNFLLFSEVSFTLCLSFSVTLEGRASRTSQTCPFRDFTVRLSVTVFVLFCNIKPPFSSIHFCSMKVSINMLKLGYKWQRIYSKTTLVSTRFFTSHHWSEAGDFSAWLGAEVTV